MVRNEPAVILNWSRSLRWINFLINVALAAWLTYRWPAARLESRSWDDSVKAQRSDPSAAGNVSGHELHCSFSPETNSDCGYREYAIRMATTRDASRDSGARQGASWGFQ